MTFKEIMATLFSTSQGTYYKWKKENRPIIKLLNDYFSNDELLEYIELGKIKKLELIKHLTVEELQNKLNNQKIEAYNEDYIIKNLTFKFLIFNNQTALISLRKIFDAIDDDTRQNINKKQLLQIIKDYPVKFFSIDTKNSKKSAIFFINNILTDYEISILIKHQDKIFTSFYDIEDIKEK